MCRAKFAIHKSEEFVQQQKNQKKKKKHSLKTEISAIHVPCEI